MYRYVRISTTLRGPRGGGRRAARPRAGLAIDLLSVA